jgi:hypothetical protein
MPAPQVTWIADGEAGNAVVTKRPLKYILEKSGMNVDTNGFTGFIPVVNLAAFSGVVFDGVTDCRIPVQAAFALAEQLNIPVYHPGGTVYVSDYILWRGQSVFGAGKDQAHFLGAPGKDVFRSDQTVAAYAFTDTGRFWRGFTIIVNDSVDVSGTADFVARGGPGNAGIAVLYPDGASATVPMRPYYMDFDITIISTSETIGGLNKSCGAYLQYPENDCTIDVRCARLAYGWWHHYPTANLTSREFACDHNKYGQLKFDSCGRACRFVNLGSARFENLVIHGGAGCTHGLQLAGVTSSIRTSCGDVHIATLMVEDQTTTPVDLGNTVLLTGDDWLISGTGFAGPIIFSAKQMHVRAAQLANSGSLPLLRLTGSRITVDNMFGHATSTAVYGQDIVDDQGFGNKVVQAWTSTGANARNRVAEVLTPDARLLHERSAVLQTQGHLSTPLPMSANDLLVKPEMITPVSLVEGVGYSVVNDSTTDLGRYLRIAGVGGNFFCSADYINGTKGLTVGKFLPPTRGSIYVCAKVATTGTQTLGFTAGGAGVTVGSTTMNWTTSFTVQRVDYDLTGKTAADALIFQLNAIGGGGSGPLDIAWIMFRPAQKDVLLSGQVEDNVVALTDAATVATDASLARVFTLAATAGRTIGAPTNLRKGMLLEYHITNSSGGAMTTTWNAVFKMPAWTDPANTKTRTVRFRCYDGTNLRQIGDVSADI